MGGALGIVLVVFVVVALTLASVPGDEIEETPTDPIDAFLAAARRGDAQAADARQRVLTLGTRVVGPLFETLLSLEANLLEPRTQLTIEETIADFGVAGVNALVPDLVSLHRRHPAVPATVRIVERVGLPILAKLSRERRVPLELRILILRRFVARGEPVWESASRDDDSAFFIASQARRSFDPATLPLDLLRACSALPGDRTASLDALLAGGSASDFPLDRFDRGERSADIDLHCLLHDELRATDSASARGWGAEEQPAHRGSDEWLRWATPRIDEVPVREAMLEVARRKSSTAFFALAALGKRDPRLVAEMLRSSRAHGWQNHQGDWLRTAIRFGGSAAEHVALERLVRGPVAEEAFVGSAFADLEVADHLDAILAGFYRMSGRAAVELEALISAGGDTVRGRVTTLLTSEDRRLRRAAIELAGRLGWPLSSALLEGALLNPLDTPFVVPAFELLRQPCPTHCAGAPNQEIRRVCELVSLLGQPR